MPGERSIPGERPIRAERRIPPSGPSPPSVDLLGPAPTNSTVGAGAIRRGPYSGWRGACGPSPGTSGRDSTGAGGGCGGALGWAADRVEGPAASDRWAFHTLLSSFWAYQMPTG